MSLHNSRFIFFTVVGVCAVAMAAARSGFAMPSGGSETPTLSSRELEEIPLRQIYNGIRVLREGVRHMLLGGQIPPAPVFDVGQRAVCTMFNFYTHFQSALQILSNTQDSCATLYGNYTSNQFVAWNLMKSACKWVQATPQGTTLLNNCTLSEISDMCLKLHYHYLTNRTQDDVDKYLKVRGFQFPISAIEWINDHLRGERLHCPAVQPILDQFICTLTSEGNYDCEED